MREWARADKRAEWAVERADRERLDILQKFFEAIGYDEEHAAMRARVFYYHQIGYYAIGVRQSIPERRKKRSEEHTSELQSLLRSAYAVFCLNKKIHHNTISRYHIIMKLVLRMSRI